LFFWTVIPAIAALVEMIVFLSTSDESFNRRYNTK
jgi:TM2 domain-containing membrane protein YozV